MSQLRNHLLPRIVESYSAYYDIHLMEADSSLYARCDFYSRNAQYVLVRKAEIWAAETFEYLYLHSLASPTAEDLTRIMVEILADGEPRIHPQKNHMSTHLTALIICDTLNPQLIPLIKKMKKHRDYRLSLHGWMEFKIAVVDLSTGKVFTNPSGKQLSKDISGFVEKERKKYENKGEK